ncbi:MAG: alpha/beta fold hydrolase [Glaciihabitans sp.]|jgi:pimeloyl-ACP methyl ester carboxylesterase|nr:alpha/beta fold hydrolase [Glaciihabitans sp.]
MTSTLLDGIVAHTVVTPRLTAAVFERPSESPTRTVVFIHGNVSSSLFWQPTMLALDPGVRALAIDLRGFGDSETLAVDGTRGVRDFSDDVATVLAELGLGAVNLVGWSMGGGVVLQYLLDHPDHVASITLVSPVSPYGFGGTAGPDGRVLNEENAGAGGGGANADFVARLAAGDTSDDPTSPRGIYRTTYVKDPSDTTYEDLWVESMLSTKTGIDNYPGDGSTAENWPGFGPGTRGVLNTMVPRHFNVSAITELDSKPPILWVHGADDVIVSDTSLFDLNFLGQLGAIPGWPGADEAPPQPMVTQTRAVLERYGNYEEIVYENCGHSAHLEHPDEFRAALTAHLK